MRYFTCVLVAFCIPASMIGAMDQAKLSPAQQEVLDASLARRDAANRRDWEAAARYIADDCLFSTDDGVVITKAQYLEHMRKLPFEYDHSTNPREFVVRLHGDAAVINFRTTAHEQFTDADIISEQRRTETWLKQNGSWALIAVQWGNMPVNFRKPIAADPKVYKDFVGQYQWRPGDDIETVYLKASKLWTQMSGDVDEYLPAGVDTFFIKEGDLGTSTFTRDAQGRVTGYTYHRIDGQEIHVKKVK